MDAKQTRQGVLLALAAYFIWGIAPAYFKLIYYVPADEILTHRDLVVFLYGGADEHLPPVVLFKNADSDATENFYAGSLCRADWWQLATVYLGGEQSPYAGSEPGYFINPLVNIVLGMIFLGERFRRMQWLAVILAICGVLVQLWTFGSLPIIALGLAFSFAFYGLVRKKIAVEAQTGMLIETMWLLPVAAIYLFAIADSSTSHMGQNPMSLNLLLIAAGIVTTVPLLCFTAAATRLRLSTLGFFSTLARR